MGLTLLFSQVKLSLFFLYSYLSFMSIKIELSHILNMVVIVVLLISFQVFVYSLFYIKEEVLFPYFFLITNVFILSMIVLLLRRRVFILFLGWDGLGVSSFFLIIFYSNWKRLNNRIITMIRNRIGDGLILILFSYFLFLGGGGMYFFSLFLLLSISITKRAQFPFSSWLPAAIAAPTPISALVHSSTLVAAGVVLLLKFRFLIGLSCNLYGLVLIGLVTMFLAGVSAINEIDFKKIVALSTLSQIGVLFFRLGLGNKWLCVIHLCSHAFFKRLLFLSVGGFLHFMFCQQDKRAFSFRGVSLFVLLTLLVTLLSLCGILFFSGFFSKDLIFERFLKDRRILFLSFIFLCSLVFTFFYRFRLLAAIFNFYSFSLYFIKISFSIVLSFIFLIILSVSFSTIYFYNFFFILFFWSFLEKYFLLLILFIFLIFTLSLKGGLILWSISYKGYLDFFTLSFSYLLFKNYKVLEKIGFENFNLLVLNSLKGALFKKNIIVLVFFLVLIVPFLMF